MAALCYANYSTEFNTFKLRCGTQTRDLKSL